MRYLVQLKDYDYVLTAISNEVESPTTALYNVVASLINEEYKHFTNTGEWLLSQLCYIQADVPYEDNYGKLLPEYIVANKVVEKIRNSNSIELNIAPIINNNETVFLSSKSFVKPSVFVYE